MAKYKPATVDNFDVIERKQKEVRRLINICLAPNYTGFDTGEVSLADQVSDLDTRVMEAEYMADDASIEAYSATKVAESAIPPINSVMFMWEQVAPEYQNTQWVFVGAINLVVDDESQKLYLYKRVE